MFPGLSPRLSTSLSLVSGARVDARASGSQVPECGLQPSQMQLGAATARGSGGRGSSRDRVMKGHFPVRTSGSDFISCLGSHTSYFHGPSPLSHTHIALSCSPFVFLRLALIISYLTNTTDMWEFPLFVF